MIALVTVGTKTVKCCSGQKREARKLKEIRKETDMIKYITAAEHRK